MNSPKGKYLSPLLSWSIKLIVIGLSWWFIYVKVFKKQDFSETIYQLKQHLELPINWLSLSIVLILMLVNWGIESLKWQYLISKIEKVSLGKSMKAVFSGVTVSSFTPFRVGEYFGRVFHLEHGNKIQGTLLTILGSGAQTLSTLLFGTIGFLALVPSKILPEQLHLSKETLSFIQPILILFSLLLLWAFLHTRTFARTFSKLNKNKRIQHYLGVLERFSEQQLFRNVLGMSLARYAVFSIQFYLLLSIFGIYIPVFEGLFAIAIVFLILSILPIVAALEMGATRGSIAIIVFSALTGSDGSLEASTLAASFLLWLINLVIPSIIGGVFILKMKISPDNILD